MPGKEVLGEDDQDVGGEGTFYDRGGCQEGARKELYMPLQLPRHPCR